MHTDSVLHQPTAKLRRSLFLLYHELRPAKCNYSYVVETAAFDKHLEMFCQLPLEGSCLTAEVTFDDGHISNFEYAMPLLSFHKMTAHFFVTVGWTGTKSNYMGWQHLRDLHNAGHTIGAHGWSHKLLTHCSKAELDIELNKSKAVLEDNLGVQVAMLSLPGGRYNRRVLGACEEAGYTKIFTSVPRAEELPTGALVGRLNVRNEWGVDRISEILHPETGRLSSLQREHERKERLKRLLGDNLYGKLWSLVNRQEPENDEVRGQ